MSQNFEKLIDPHLLQNAQLTELIVRIGRQDKAALREFYYKTSPKLFGLVFCIVRDSAVAESLLQEVYLKVWQRAADYNVEGSPALVWVTVLARTMALDEARKKNHLGNDAQDYRLETTTPDSAEALGRLQDLENEPLVLRCLGKLETTKRQMIVFAYVYGWTRNQLEAQFKMPVGTIKIWLRRGLSDLRACMDSYG